MPYMLCKRWALLVLIAGLATFLSGLTVDAAAKARCPTVDLRGKLLRVEMGQNLTEVVGRAELDCALKGFAAETRADFFLIVSYGVLTAAIFFLLAALGADRTGMWLPILGVFLATVAVVADVIENLQFLYVLSHPALRPALLLLRPVTSLKWGALAIASLAAGAVYLFLWRRSAAVIVAVLGTSTAVILLWMLCFHPDLQIWGVRSLLLFWLAAMIHAAMVLYQVLARNHHTAKAA